MLSQKNEKKLTAVRQLAVSQFYLISESNKNYSSLKLYFVRMLSKISCSFYNAAAIAENEDLYLWGSIQSGLLGTEQTKPQV